MPARFNASLIHPICPIGVQVLESGGSGDGLEVNLAGWEHQDAFELIASL
jgi:hypothetical protein